MSTVTPATYIMSTPPVLEALRKLRIIIGAVRQHARALESACGVSGAQVWMLATIAERPDLTVSQLSQALSVHVSTASNLLDKMDRAGLIERQRVESDRRLVRLRLTDAGRNILAKAPVPISGLLTDALEKMPLETLHGLDQALGELILHMKQVDPNAAHEPLSNLMR